MDEIQHSDAEERNWALIGHLSALSGIIIPFGNIIGPLIVWLVKRDTMPFASSQAREALNFNITMTIAALISSVLILILVGFLLLGIIFIAWLVLTIMAAIAASKGEAYRYPFTLRLVS